MRNGFLSKGFAVAGAMALALSGAACADADDRVENMGDEAEREVADATAPRGHEGAAVTLTGCLQEGGAMDGFILTRVNEPSGGAVGTSGTSAGTEQMRAAKHSYQLESDDDDQLEKHVGKQVRVTGTLEEMSELNRQQSGEQSRGADRDAARRDIDADDLAKVNVTSIVQVADACGAEGR